MRYFALFFLLLASACSTAQESTGEATFTTVEISVEDGVTVTGDLYAPHTDLSTPFIVLCHQAGWSRGEYREIAPKLNELGFNCIAIDQRSGGEVNGVANQTMASANKLSLKTTFVDAEQDIVAAVKHAKENYAKGKLLVWGSSYSAALTLKVAADHPEIVDGALAFAPGEYFGRLGKSGDWIQSAASSIQVPVFVTSARGELGNWEAIFNAIPSETKAKFLPETKGNHGSRALWEKFDDHEAYWTAVKGFLAHFTDANAEGAKAADSTGSNSR